MDVDHPGAGLLVTNVRVFDGIGDEAVPGHVRVERDRIAEVVLGAPPRAAPGERRSWTAGAARSCRGSPTRTSTCSRSAAPWRTSSSHRPAPSTTRLWPRPVTC
ncbi:hypothetical protein ACFQ0M_02935 [Kitasatospora aburaviensis]